MNRISVRVRNLGLVLELGFSYSLIESAPNSAPYKDPLPKVWSMRFRNRRSDICLKCSTVTDTRVQRISRRVISTRLKNTSVKPSNEKNTRTPVESIWIALQGMREIGARKARLLMDHTFDSGSTTVHHHASYCAHSLMIDIQWIINMWMQNEWFLS